ncbi:PD-(D/E)XK nuclease family protein [Alistipes sp. OttesenSCG-928-B03]|nr:PD-(D/E)XK nuclease family protein [Alistipes sp. OttesenSCG-928-B03]
MEIIQIKSALSFTNLLEGEHRVNFHNLLSFLSEFRIIYDREKANLPYHINLIDELHADENAHSRIFAQLLRYKENGNYPFLTKFLNDVCGFDVSVESPTVEKVDSCGRIDIPIFDKKYVVLIENKVTDKAADQNGENGGQLARYIETINRSYGRSTDEIYVVYTPKYTREPSDDCWKNRDNFSYKDEFRRRFRSVSYRDFIYPWLKNEILPTIAGQHIYLRSATEQYIDHLEGLFSLRTINNKMNMKLQEFIKQELNLKDSDPEEAIEILLEKESELDNAVSQIQELKSEYRKLIAITRFNEWEAALRRDFPSFDVVGDQFKLNKAIINTGVRFNIGSLPFTALVEYDRNTDEIYFGIGKHFSSDTKHSPEVLQSILNKTKLDNEKPNTYWYGWRSTSSQDGYMRLKNLIEVIEADSHIQMED